MTDLPPDIDDEYYELVGRIVSDWAALEAIVNDCIWATAGTPFGVGAAITAQIYTLDGRLKALAAILGLKNQDDLVGKVNAFAKSARKASEKRNRAAHDMWLNDWGQPRQLAITADRKLHFALEARDLDTLRADHKIVEEALLNFDEIRQLISARLPTLPGTRPLAIQATLTRHDPKRTPAIPEKTQPLPPQS